MDVREFWVKTKICDGGYLVTSNKFGIKNKYFSGDEIEVYKKIYDYLASHMIFDYLEPYLVAPPNKEASEMLEKEEKGSRGKIKYLKVMIRISDIKLMDS